MYESERVISISTLGGDAMPISRADAALPARPSRLRELFKDADAGIINGEMLFHNYEDWSFHLSQTHMRRISPTGDLPGVDILGCASEHKNRLWRECRP